MMNKAIDITSEWFLSVDNSKVDTAKLLIPTIGFYRQNDVLTSLNRPENGITILFRWWSFFFRISLIKDKGVKL